MHPLNMDSLTSTPRQPPRGGRCPCLGCFYGEVSEGCWRHGPGVSQPHSLTSPETPQTTQANTWAPCCSVTKTCCALCDPMDCSTPGFPVPQHLPGLAQTHVHGVRDAIQPSYPLLPPSIFPSIRVFSNESVLCIGGQSIGASASASVIPVNIQG